LIFTVWMSIFPEINSRARISGISLGKSYL
jgi:hypothetical protein